MWDFDHVSGVYTPSGDSTDELYIRRARIGVDGVFQKNWAYELVLNFRNNAGSSSKSSDGLEWDTATLSYLGFKQVRIDFGRMKRPLGLEIAESSKWISTISRSIIWDVASGISTPNQALINFRGFNAGFGWNLYIVDDGEETSAGATQFSYGTRLHYAHKEAETVFHLGFGYADMNPSGSSIEESASTRGNSYINKFDGSEARKMTVLESSYTSEEDTTIVIEAAYQQGPFSIQTEYMKRNFESASIDGAYLQLAYTLTGEKRVYKEAKGKFDKIVPGQSGAIELVGKYEMLSADSDHQDAITEDVSVFTIGANYYPNINVKLMFNIFQLNTGAVNKNNKNDEDGLGIRARAQYVY